METPRIRLAALALAAASFVAPTEQRIAFAPEEGSRVAKRFRVEISGAVDDAEILVNGEAQDPALAGVDAIEGEAELVVAVVDEYRSLAGGRPLELARTFEEMVLVGRAGDGEPDRTEAERFQGKTVVFVWDEDTGTYERSFADGTEDEEGDLAGLAEDLDLRALLPHGPVEEGDEWSVSVDVLAAVAVPGIDLGALSEMDRLEDVPPAVLDAFKRIYRGADATVRYAGRVEVDGAPLERLEVAWELDTSEALDASELVEGADDRNVDELTVDLDVQLEGECLWDAAAGRWHSLEASGDAAMTVTATMLVRTDELELPIEARFEMSAELTSTGTTETR